MIFADDPARLAIYQLYDGRSASNADAPASPEALFVNPPPNDPDAA